MLINSADCAPCVCERERKRDGGGGSDEAGGKPAERDGKQNKHNLQHCGVTPRATCAHHGHRCRPRDAAQSRRYDSGCKFEGSAQSVCVFVYVCAPATQLPVEFVHGSSAEGTSTRSINTGSVLSSSLFFFLPHDGAVPQHGPAQRSTVQAELIYLSAVQSNLNKQISP